MFRFFSVSRLSAWILLVLVLAHATAVPHAFGLPHPHRMAKQQIEDLEQQWRTATLTSDTAVMDHLLSDDYVGISWNGQVNTKAMQLDRVRTRTLALTRLDLSDSKIKVVHDIAIVTARASVVGTVEGSPIAGIFRYTRVYQRGTSGNWKITNFEVTRVDAGKHSRHEQDPIH